MNNLDYQYGTLVRYITDFGAVKKDRTGVGTKSVFDYNISLSMSEGFPLLTMKETHFKSVLHEFLWLINAVDDKYKKFGPTNIKYLEDNNCKIWTQWAYEPYEKLCVKQGLKPMDMKEFREEIINDNDGFALEFGGLGPIYGYQKRFWMGKVDQLQNAIDDLRNNPDSRRIIVDLWEPSTLHKQAIPPCHMFYQFWTREMSTEERIAYCKAQGWGNDFDFTLSENNTEENVQDYITYLEHNGFKIPKRMLSLKFMMRSVDVILGLPFDVASYGLMLATIANVVNMVPYELKATFNDTHIYLNHFENIPKFIDAESKELPTLKINNPTPEDINSYRFEHYELSNYNPNPKVKFDVAV